MMLIAGGDGTDLALDELQRRAPGGAAALNTIISQQKREATAVNLKRESGCHPAALNARESWSLHV